jgi:hypothetical protein
LAAPHLVPIYMLIIPPERQKIMINLG